MNNIPKDKLYHFIAGFLLCVIFTLVDDPITGIGAAICGGIAKECYDDYQYGGFDGWDMVFTWVGGCVAFTLLALIRYWF